MGLESVVQPFKALSLFFHLLIIIVTFFSYEDNIKASDRTIYSRLQPNYLAGRTAIFSCNITAIVLISLELVALFSGLTLIQHGTGIASAALHYTGCILWNSFIYYMWRPESLWLIWLATSLPAALLQLKGVVGTSLKYRRSQ